MRLIKFGGLALLVVLMSGCTLPWAKRNQGALQVTSNLAAAVHLDDSHVGQTPYYNENLKMGEYTLKLAANDSSGSRDWQSKISIGRRVLTVVNYEYGKSIEDSSYEVMELESLATKTGAELTISTLPDNVIVKLDGELKGFSPISFDQISAGDHTLGLEAPGYKSKTINAKVNDGHRLKIKVQLARDMLAQDQEATSSAQLETTAVPASPSPTPKPSASPSPKTSPSPKASPSPSPKASASPSPSAKTTPSPTPQSGVISGAANSSELEVPYVKILESGTGWLRVRSEPAASGDNEVAKVKVGTYFKFIEKNDAGWTKIEHQSGQEGWVASKYTQLTE